MMIFFSYLLKNQVSNIGLAFATNCDYICSTNLNHKIMNYGKHIILRRNYC